MRFVPSRTGDEGNMRAMRTKGLAGVRVLVVEDNHMVAASLVEALNYAGATVVGTIANREDAIDFVEVRHQEIDIAMLDVDLSGVMSYPIADMLGRYDVPFIFTTGYDNTSMDAAYRDFPLCMKPFSFDSIVSTIRGVLGSGMALDQ